MAGIAVMASASGGLIEAVADPSLLVDDYSNILAWVKAIRSFSVSEDPAPQLAVPAVDYIAKFDPRNVGQQLLRIVRGK